METIKDYPVKRFSDFERHEPLVKDNSSLSEFKKCPTRYFYRYVLGYTEEETPPYFAFGTAYHKFREVLEQSFQKYNKDSKNVLECGSLAFIDGIKAAQECYKKESVGINMEYQYGKYAFLTWERLAQSCEEVFRFWLKEKQSGHISVIASEQPFTVSIGRINGEEIFMGGRFDEIISWDGKVHGRDFKTTTTLANYYHKRINPNSQFAFYTYAESMLHGERVKGQLVEVLFNAKTIKPKIVQYPVTYTDDQILDWVDDALYWNEQVQVAREKDHYPMNETGCAFCPFQKVCVMPNENGKVSVLKNQFTKKLWDYTLSEE